MAWIVALPANIQCLVGTRAAYNVGFPAARGWRHLRNYATGNIAPDSECDDTAAAVVGQQMSPYWLR